MPADSSNPEFFYGNTSVLRQGEPVRSEIMRAILTGLRMGLGFGLFVIFVVGVAMVWSNTDPITRRWFSLICLITGPLLGMLATTLYYFADSKTGYFGVSDEVISFRTPFKKITIPLEKIFGAGSEPHGTNNWLRICYLADNVRGFKSMLCNFRFYEAESGPIMDEKRDGLDGNEVARLAIITHIRHRLKTEMPVASIPEFRFEATCDHRRSLDAIMDIVIKGYFRCDGRYLEIQEEVQKIESGYFDGLHKVGGDQSIKPGTDLPVKTRRHIVEVTNVAEVAFNTEPVLDSVTMPGMWIHLKEPKDEVIRIHVDAYSYSREIKKYCKCLPTLFPFYDDTEFWFSGDEYYGGLKKIEVERAG
ncbi:MAG: hypothetical protein NTY09_01715 [bacterium]|nr:hypothetical protein [bacterium]